MSKFSYMKKFFLFVFILFSFTACGANSDSDELEALRSEIEMLKADATTTPANVNSMEKAWIEVQVENFDDLGVSEVSRDEAECTLKNFLDDVGLSTARAEFGRENASKETMRTFFLSLIECSDIIRIISEDFFSDPEMNDVPTEFLECATEVLSKDQNLLVDIMMEDSSFQSEETMRTFLVSVNECIDIGSLLAKEFLKDPEMEEMPTEFLDCTIRLIEKDSKLVVELMMLGVSGDDSDENIETLMTPLIPDLLICLGESLSGEDIEKLFNVEDSIEDWSNELLYEEPESWNDQDRLVLRNFTESCEEANSDLPEFQAVNYCDCVIRNIQNSTSFEKFKELDDLVEKQGGEVADEVISENYPWLIDSSIACS